MHFPFFRCIGAGLLPGSQSIDRAEFFACLQVLLHCATWHATATINIHTDSSYVIKIIDGIRSGGCEAELHHLANADLILQAIPLIQNMEIRLHKVKSHQKLKEITDPYLRWQALGNSTVDHAATRALCNIPGEMKQTIERAVEFDKGEADMLEKVLNFMAENNLSRHLKLQDDVVKQMRVQRNFVLPGNQQSYADYTVVHGTTDMPEELDLQCAQASLQGTRLAFAVHTWWKQLKWPLPNPDGSFGVDADHQSVAQSGISWVELAINFAISTGWFFPLRLRGSGADSVFGQYNDIEVRALPYSARAAAKQSVACQDFFKCISTLTDCRWYPDFVSRGCSSLQRLGYRGETTGIFPRPQLPCQMETIQYISGYLEKLAGVRSLSHTLDDLIPSGTVEVCADVVEPTSRDRFLCYEKLRKRLRRRQ
eukprot:Skav227063  [mRNA]  locus=scaffold72:976673:977947:+ [translate_table: standard]